MAKDNRTNKNIRIKKTTRTTDGSKQVPLSQRAAEKPSAAKTAKKKKGGFPVGKVILGVLSLALIITLVVFIFTAIDYGKSLLKSDNDTSDVSTIDLEERSDVAYYLVGLLGEEKSNGKTGTMPTMALVCYDKLNQTVNVLQIPSATYLGDKTRWKVNTIGNVWSNPMPLDWCETCRRSVYESEIKDGKHDTNAEDGTYCGTKITQKTGSSVQNLLEVFSYQYTIPVDNYYLIPQSAFVKLVDLVGGVDIKLSSGMTLADTYYEAGTQTVDGEGALEYVLGESKGVSGQVSNLVRQRQVFVALFARMFASNQKTLDEDVLYPLMKGSTPIRTKRDNEIDEDVMLMVNLVLELGKVDQKNVTFYTLPGEVATLEGDTFYSVHKGKLVELLNESFNPYNTPITEEYLRMTELADTKKDDLHKATFASLLVKQTGAIAESSDDDE